MELEDVFFMLANGLAISVIGIILIVVLPQSPVQSQVTANSYISSIVKQCSLLNEDITCLTNNFNSLKEDFNSIYEEQGNSLNIIITNEDGEIEYHTFSDESTTRITTRINSCNLFGSCITKYYSQDRERYKILIL